MAKRIPIGGQNAWVHDEGHRSGVFTTFDALDVGGAFGPRRVHVLVPRDAAPGRRYPAIWLHDGDTAFWPGGVARKTWDVAGTLSALAGRVQPAVVVAVTPVDRNAEYTHADWAHGARTWGRLPAHADWLADRLKPFVDAHFPTDPRRTVIAGSSHGGLASFWAATRRPDAFGAAGCLSPSFFTGIDSLRHGPRPVALSSSELVGGAAAVLADPARRPRLWICWGLRRDGGEHNAVVEALAARRGEEMISMLQSDYGYRRQVFDDGTIPDPAADLFTHVDRVGGHDEDAWRWRFGLMVRALLPAG